VTIGKIKCNLERPRYTKENRVETEDKDKRRACERYKRMGKV
jgi:hypothetical protein